MNGEVDDDVVPDDVHVVNANAAAHSGFSMYGALVLHRAGLPLLMAVPFPVVLLQTMSTN